MAHGNQHGSHAPGATHEAVPLDPENDIDAKSATIWVLVGTVVLFLALWVMVPIFMRINEAERQNKIYGVKSQELEDVVDAEQQFLNGANPTKRTIEQVLKQMAGK
ncbi:MAG: hypothetical protein MUC36_07570 [Planctomycetes bacterium]|jgi:hypothetical protein|nr:hypothetical protein [Planctomycetota bacterium]